MSKNGEKEPKEQQRKKLIIVDDEPGNIDMLTQLVKLYFKDVDVYSAHDGQQFLALLDTVCPNPDAVITDLRMDPMSGVMAINKLIELGRFDVLAVMFAVSANPEYMKLVPKEYVDTAKQFIRPFNILDFKDRLKTQLTKEPAA